MPSKQARKMRTKRRVATRTVLLTLDSLAMILAAVVSTYIRFGDLSHQVSFDNSDFPLTFVQLGAILAPIWIGILWSDGLYKLERLAWGSGEFSRVARGLALGVVAFIILTYAMRLTGFSRAWTLIFWMSSTVFVILGRTVMRGALHIARRRGRWTRPALIVGSNAEASDIVRILKASRAEGLVPVGCLASSQAERLSLDWCAQDVPCLGTARELLEIISEHSIDTVIIASSAFDHDVLARMLAEVRNHDIDVNVSSGLFEVLTSRVVVREVGGVPLISIRGVPLSVVNVATKRAFDLLVAGLVLLLGLPVWMLIALSIKLNSRGPILFMQERIGKGGEHFGMFKFRSMIIDADERIAALNDTNEASGPLFKMKKDPRVTAVGKWMRKFSVDEFPQLLNVLKGEMSLVGPRPPLPREVERYTAQDWRRLEVVPGMTGLWQVSGRSVLTFDEMVRLDLFYIENWSVGLDMSLILRTVPAVIFARGAY